MRPCSKYVYVVSALCPLGVGEERDAKWRPSCCFGLWALLAVSITMVYTRVQELPGGRIPGQHLSLV